MPGYTPLYSFEYPVNADPVWKAAGTIERLARAIESKIAGGVGAAVTADPNTVVRRDANGRAFITDPTIAGHIASKAYVDRGSLDTLTAAKQYADTQAGEPGPAGATGPEGPAGPAGPRGPEGPQGAPGPAGDTGPAGPAGIAGPRGPEGPQGIAGPEGPEGPAGPEGAGLELAGAVAEYANLPAEAPLGSTWLVSSEGRVYVRTEDGWPAENTGGLIQGPEGPAGPAGPAGARGPEGPAGPEGDPGPAGPTGPAGPAGVKGDAGPEGPAGPAGPAGVKGDTGPAGTAGERGPAGPAGPKGDPGAQGPAGPAGMHGILTTVTARARRTTLQTIPNATDTLVTFNSAEWDTVGNMYSSAGLYCRQSGVYLVEAQFPWSGNEIGRRNIKVLRNSTTGAGAVLMDAEPAVAWENIVQCSGHVRLTSGDLLRVMVAQDCGGSLTGGVGSGSTQASLSATLLRSL